MSSNMALNLAPFGRWTALKRRRLALRWAHMDRRKISSALMLAMLIILGGCSAVNLLFDDKQVFVSERNSEIGKPISKVLNSTRYYPYWDNQPAHIKQHYKKVAVEGEKTEYQFSQSTCEWALVVNDRTNVVTAWRYIRDTADCAYKQFHEGPF